MPKWFANPPASFEAIRIQSRRSQLFWIPLFILLIILMIISLATFWEDRDIRNHIIGAMVCFLINGILSGSYFIKEVLAFSKIPVNAPQTPELLKRTRSWLRWTTLRDILQFLAAAFLTIAYNHS